MKFIHKVFLTARSKEDEECMGWNDPDPSSKGDWEICIFLDKFYFRKNINHIKCAKEIQRIFLLELVCSLSRVEKYWKEERCNECPPWKITKKIMQNITIK